MPEYLFSLEYGGDDEYHLLFDCEAVSGIREEYDLSECESVLISSVLIFTQCCIPIVR